MPSFSLVRLALRRPWTVVVLVLGMLLGAWSASQKMARDVFPSLGVPTIYVAQPFGGMDPLQMEGFLTYYYEYHFLYITGIEHVESKSIQGASLMKLQFHPGTDMSNAMAETVAYVNRARAFMPPGTPGPFVTRFDSGSVPVGNLVFSTQNPQRTVGQMQDAALNMVRPLFATLPGVSAPPPFGGSARTILITAKPERLRAYALSPDEIVAAVTAANPITPSGNLATSNAFPIVPTNAVVKNIQDLAAVPLRVTPEGSVFLRDVAEVSDGSDLVTSIALVNGRRTVYMPVTKRSDASTLRVVELVKANLPKFQAACPDDIHVSFEFDQSPWIERALRDLLKEGLLGAALTGLMVLLFLRNFRSALIVVLNIPISIAAALLALWLTGQTLNLMTLGGLALAVGILVDEATVAMENLHTHLHHGSGLARAALDAVSETALPRLLAMLCVVAVFLPALFMEGAARGLFAPLAISVALSMLASYLLSSTLLPVLSVWWMKNPAPASPTPSPLPSPSSSSRFGKRTSALLALRWILVPLYFLATAALLLLLFPRLGLEIFPQIDAGQIQLRFRAPSGTRLEQTEQTAHRILSAFAEEAGPNEVAISMALLGVHASNYPVNLLHQWNSGPEEGVLQIQLRPHSPLRVAALREKLRKRFAAEMPEIRLSFEPADIVSRVMALGSSTPIEVALSGKDFALTRSSAERVQAKLQTLPALRDVQIAQTLDYPSLEVQVDRERAGLQGIRMVDATRSLVAATASSRFTTPNYWADAKTGVSYSLQIQTPQAQPKTTEDLLNLPVSGPSGRSTLLRHFAKISEGSVIGQYDRYNMARTLSVTANLHGTDLGHAARQIEAALREVSLPPGVSLALRGQIPPLRQLESGLRSGLGAALVVILLLLTANFQSVRLALLVLSTAPAAIAGVLLALAATHSTLNLQSFMGAILAIGVCVSNAILLVTLAAKLQTQGASRHEAALGAVRGRVRPILMTSLAMMAGMLPMALSGSSSAPLAIAVLGGLLLSTLATLLFLPPLFAIAANPTPPAPSLDPDDPECRLPKASVRSSTLPPFAHTLPISLPPSA
jgi:multidrug efflux pump subunit AcrB